MQSYKFFNIYREVCNSDPTCKFPPKSSIECLNYVGDNDHAKNFNQFCSSEQINKNCITICNLANYNYCNSDHSNCIRKKQLSDKDVTITIINETGQDCYVLGIAGSKSKIMEKIKSEGTNVYFIQGGNDDPDSSAVNFSLFTTSDGTECNKAIANATLFEINTNSKFPSMDISFNAGKNYGMKIEAISKDTKLTRIATTTKSAATYGDKTSSQCQVQPCAVANNMVDYDPNDPNDPNVTKIDLIDDFSTSKEGGGFKEVIVTFFPYASKNYKDTKGPCGTKQCPGYSCTNKNNDFCTTSGSDVYCWQDFNPAYVNETQLSDLVKESAPLCPRCDYLNPNNENYEIYQDYMNKTQNPNWTYCGF